jgi:flagellin
MSNMVVRTNVLALNSHRNLGMVGNQQARASARLSSGFRINSAADDAAGLGISEKMRGQIRGLNQASRNAQDGISLIQTAEGAMATINEMVVRLRELVVQAANDTNAHDQNDAATWSQSDRTKIQEEINQLMEEIDRTAERTEFNTRKLIDGSLHGMPIAARNALNALVGTQAVQDLIGDLAQANTNFSASQSAIASANNWATRISALQSTVESILGDAGEILAASGVNTAAAAVTAVGGELASRLTATGLFGTVTAAQLALTDAMFEANASGFTSAGNDHLAGAMRNTLVTAWLANAGTGLPASFVSGHAAATAAGAHTEALALTNWATVTSALVSTGDFVTAATPLMNGNVTAANTATNGLNTALRNNEHVRQYVSDWNTASTMMSGPVGQSLWFQVGANKMQGVSLSVASINVDALNRVSNFAGSGVELGFNFASLRTVGTGIASQNSGVMRERGEDINKFITSIDFALSHVISERSNLGAMQNRLEYTIQNLDVSSENLSAAESRIRDADMALEMMRLTQANVLQQAATAMLAQANQSPQSILQLLG